MVGQPQDLVPGIEEDDYSMTVDSQDNGSPVIKLLSKQHQSNNENVLPSTSRATRSTQSPVNRPILSNLTNKSTQKQQSRLDEIREEALNVQQDEYMLQLNSPTPSQVLVTNQPVRHSSKGNRSTSRLSRENTHSEHQRSDSESDDAVTLKNPKVKIQYETKLSDRSTDEEIITSDGET